MVDEYVTKEDCRRIHEDLTYQFNDTKDLIQEVDGKVDVLDRKLESHDVQAKEICLGQKTLAKDVDKQEKKLDIIIEIVRETAVIQNQLIKDEQERRVRMDKIYEFAMKWAGRSLTVGILVILGFFGIKMGEAFGWISGLYIP